VNVLSEEKKQQATTLGRFRLVAAPNSASHADSPRNRRGLSESRRNPRARIRRVGTTAKPKPSSGTRPSTRPPSIGQRCEPYREIVEAALSKGRSAMAIFQDLVHCHGFPGKYSSVNRCVRKLRRPTIGEARLMFPTAAGEDRMARRLMASPRSIGCGKYYKESLRPGC
jgi:hypothetical protein